VVPLARSSAGYEIDTDAARVDVDADADADAVHRFPSRPAEARRSTTGSVSPEVCSVR
jgi:hypothetical protein